MIDEKQLVIEKLKDTAVDYLTEKMIDDVGKLSEQYQNQLNDRIVEWVKASQPYFSTTEFRKAYKDVCEKHKIIFFSLMLGNQNQQIDIIDEWYDLDDTKLMPNRGSHIHVGSAALGRGITKNHWTKYSSHSGPNSSTSTNNNLKTLLKNIRNKQDRRKVKRLSRKKKVKGGISLI